MWNTFINDRLTDTFPFTPGAGLLPFSLGCISDIRVCVRTENEDVSVPDICVSGVEITGTEITVTLCLEDVFICNLTAETGKYSNQVRSSVDYNETTFIIAAYMQAGVILEQDIGTYKVNRSLDMSCITRMPCKAHRILGPVKINGVEINPPEVLTLQTAGYIKGEVSITDQDDLYDFSLVLTGSVPTDAKLTAQEEETVKEDYSMVRTVNTLPFGGMYASDPEDYTKTLTVCVRPYAKEQEGANEGSKSNKAVLTYTVLDAVDYATAVDAIESGTAVGGAKATIIEIKGTSSFPHCYGDKDEADSSEEDSGSSSSSSGGSSGSTTNQDHWNAGTGADAGWGVPGYITGNPDWWKPGYGAPTQGN